MHPYEHQARDFAILHHGDQRYGSEPYEVHLAEVAGILRSIGADRGQMQAAWLHDVVEDVKDMTCAIVAVEFNVDVSDLVWAVTGIGHNRKTRVASVIPKLLACPRAVTLKQADRLGNGRRSQATSPEKFSMYRKEFGHFHRELRHLGDERLWQELEALFL